MLLTVAMMLLFLWVLGFITNFAGGLIHIALIAALVMFAIHFIKEHRNSLPAFYPALRFKRFQTKEMHEPDSTGYHRPRRL
jgi:uncharacterized protein (DUF58 family)